MKSYFILLFLLWMNIMTLKAQTPDPLRIAVDGLTHTHVHWLLGREDRGDVIIVGIAEPNRELAQRYAKQHGYSMDIVFDDLETTIAQTKPEAVTAFNPIIDHLKTVQVCAPKGIHVMVEKPLAVSLEHALEMEQLAQDHGIELLTNYETTWYGSNHRLYDMVIKEEAIGPIRKVVVHDGHPGPKEIGVNEEFLEWLTDPVANGGGAITDFGCYGANLITWLLQGQLPISVTGITQTIKPDVYPKVDDEATIILTYPESQGIIQASWNWPVNRKDMTVYGKTGYIKQLNGTDMMVRLREDDPEEAMEAPSLAAEANDPFAYLAGVIRGTIQPAPYDLSSLENNMVVMKILEAAKQSAKEGITLKLAN